MTTKRVLNVKVGEPIEASLGRAANFMETLERGERARPYFGIGFENMGQMLAVFTPRRWELLAAMRDTGPATTAALARHVRRDYKNVHNDIDRLVEWQAVEKDAQGLVFAPYDEIVVEVRMPVGRAA
jgi:predicted transcriptional regulator